MGTRCFRVAWEMAETAELRSEYCKLTCQNNSLDVRVTKTTASLNGTESAFLRSLNDI